LHTPTPRAFFSLPKKEGKKKREEGEEEEKLFIL